jgi:hypothetical protein
MSARSNNRAASGRKSGMKAASTAAFRRAGLNTAR